MPEMATRASAGKTPVYNSQSRISSRVAVRDACPVLAAVRAVASPEAASPAGAGAAAVDDLQHIGEKIKASNSIQHVHSA